MGRGGVVSSSVELRENTLYGKRLLRVSGGGIHSGSGSGVGWVSGPSIL